jgi:hypothetical protein
LQQRIRQAAGAALQPWIDSVPPGPDGQVH